MKRKIFGTMLVASLALGVTACTKNDKTETNTQTPSSTTQEEQTTEENTQEAVEDTTEEATPVSTEMTDVYNKLVEANLLPIGPTEPMSPKDYYIFEAIKDKIEDGFVTKALMNVKLQDVFVIKTKDVDAVKNAINEYLNSHEMKSFGDGYGGEANIEAVRNAKLATIGDYVYFVATPNSSDIAAKLDELLK